MEAEIGISGVSPIIKRLLLQEDLPVIIQADKDSNHGIFAKLYDEAKLAGAKKIVSQLNNKRGTKLHV